MHAIEDGSWWPPLSDFSWDDVMPVGERDPQVTEEGRKRSAALFRSMKGIG